MNVTLKAAVAVTCLGIAAQAAAQATLYEHDDFQGRSFTTERGVDNFDRTGFNDRASSVVVTRDRWEVCEDAGFAGRCVVLRPGSYPSLSAMGLSDRVSSVRMLAANARYDDNRYPPAALPAYDSRPRHDERLYEADVTSVHAVLGASSQRCWVERSQVSHDSSTPNVAGAIVGAVIGGVLGHQIGDGRGRDVATAGGAVAGAAIGSQVGHGTQTSAQEVQQCADVPSNARPEYWDVTYQFRGVAHSVQMTAPPGTTITVNEQGEPRA